MELADSRTKKTFSLIHATHPCTELVLDENKIRGYLIQAGWREIPEVKTADLLVIATCAFNQDYEDDAVEAIQKTTKIAKAGARVIVAGCFSKINPERYAEVCQHEALPPRQMRKLEEMVPSEVSLDSIEAHMVDLVQYETNPLFMTGIKLKKLFDTLPLVKAPTWLDTVPMTDWYFIRGATGCRGACTYCGIKNARGSIKSVPVDLIIAQIQKAVGRGHREISIAGDDMGCYGIDIDTDLPTLLTEVVRLPGEFSLNLRFVEPMWLIKYLDQLIPLFQSGRITTFCAPIQSGSQRILTAMNKTYDIDEAVGAINDLLRKTKLRSISSNMMVGFPGETLEDWEKSYRLLETCDMNLYQVLKYQGRPGVPSESFEGKVPDPLKEKRRQRFVTKMKVLKFVGLPNSIAEAWTRARHGSMV